MAHSRGTFIINCKENAKLFDDFSAKQCTLIINDNVLPNFQYIITARIESIVINKDDILSLVRSFNPKKARKSDEILGQMLLICDDAVVLPLMIIF